MKRCQKADFLSPSEAPKSNIVTKEKESRKGEEKERKRRKKAMAALLVFIMATLETVFGPNN